jgi:hypothetical protein
MGDTSRPQWTLLRLSQFALCKPRLGGGDNSDKLLVKLQERFLNCRLIPAEGNQLRAEVKDSHEKCGIFKERLSGTSLGGCAEAGEISQHRMSMTRLASTYSASEGYT